MKRLFTIIVLSLSLQNVLCQTEVDQEMRRLMEVVASLRLSDKTQQRLAWKKAAETLSCDKAWTIMDERKPQCTNA